jgi:hypothetical protein
MRGGWTSYTSPRETLAAAYSRPNSEALAERVVLAHSCVAFHPYMCELYEGAVVVDAALIGYDDVEVATRTTTRRRSWTTTSSKLMRDYVESLLQLFFCCSAHLVVIIHYLLLVSILGWYGRSNSSVAYPYPYTCHDIIHGAAVALLRPCRRGDLSVVLGDLLMLHGLTVALDDGGERWVGVLGESGDDPLHWISSIFFFFLWFHYIAWTKTSVLGYISYDHYVCITNYEPNSTLVHVLLLGELFGCSKWEIDGKLLQFMFYGWPVLFDYMQLNFLVPVDIVQEHVGVPLAMARARHGRCGSYRRHPPGHGDILVVRPSHSWLFPRRDKREALGIGDHRNIIGSLFAMIYFYQAATFCATHRWSYIRVRAPCTLVISCRTITLN